MFLGRQRVAPSDLMIALEATAAAGGRCVLGHEYRMTAIRRLFPVATRLRGRDPRRNQLLGVSPDRAHPAQLDERALAPAQMKPSAERLASDQLEPRVDHITRCV